MDAFPNRIPELLRHNVLLYTAAVTTKEYLKDLNEKYTKKIPKPKLSQSIINIEEKIIR